MSVRPRSRAPASVGAPVYGSLHGPCIDLKPGVLPPTPAPTGTIKDEFARVLKERTTYDQASRDMFDLISRGSWFSDMSKEYRQRKREEFAKYVEEQASKLFGGLSKADALAPLQKRKSKLPNDAHPRQYREYTVLEGLIELVYKMVEKNQKKQEYTDGLRIATKEVGFRQERLDIARRNVDAAKKLREGWDNATKELVKQLKKLENDRTYITGHDLYDPMEVHDPRDAITQALDDTAPPLADDQLEEAEGVEEDWAMKEARKERQKFEPKRQAQNLPPLPSNYILAQGIREEQNLRGKGRFAPGLTLAEKKARAKQMKKAGELDGDWAEQLARAEREEKEKAKGVNYDEQTAARMDALRAQALREEVAELLREEEEEEEEEEDSCDEGEEYSRNKGTPCPEHENHVASELGNGAKSAIAAAVNCAKWKPIPKVLGEDWGAADPRWWDYDINEERTMARRRSSNGEYVYYNATKDRGGIITGFELYE